MNENLNFLKQNHLFKGLTEEEIHSVSDLAEEIECRAGAQLIFNDIPCDSFYIIKTGEISVTKPKSSSENFDSLPQYKTLFQGDILNIQALTPIPEEKIDARCRIKSTLLRWSRQRIDLFLSKNPKSINHLKPVFDETGKQTAGLPSGLYKKVKEREIKQSHGKKQKNIHYKGRRSLKRLLFDITLISSFGLFFLYLHLQTLIENIFLFPVTSTTLTVALSFYGFFMLMRLFFHVTHYHELTDTDINLKTFKIRGFSIENIKIPLTQIEGIEVEFKGLIHRAFQIGSVIVKSASNAGLIEFKRIDHPIKLKEKVLKLKKECDTKKDVLLKEEIRNEADKIFEREDAVVKILGPSDKELGIKSGEEFERPTIFRKSRFVLIRNTFSPLLVTAIIIAFRIIFAQYIGVPISLVLFTIIGISSIVFLWRTIDWQNDIFKVETGFVYDINKKPFGKSENRRQISLASAQNITTNQKGLLSFIFNFGDVYVMAAGGGADIRFESVSDPLTVQATLFEAREKKLAEDSESESKRRLKEILTVNRVLSGDKPGMIPENGQGNLPQRAPISTYQKGNFEYTDPSGTKPPEGISQEIWDQIAPFVN